MDLLTRDQQRIVQAIYDVFREHGRWPIVDAIGRIADERWEFELDAYAVLRSLPPATALVDRRHLREDQEVKLRVRAIANCDGSEEDLALFVRTVRWLAEKERSFRPLSMHAAEQVKVTSEQLAADLEVRWVPVRGTAPAASQARRRLRATPFAKAGGGRRSVRALGRRPRPATNRHGRDASSGHEAGSRSAVASPTR